MAQTKIMNYDMQKYYDSKIKAHIKSADDAVLEAAKAHAEGLAENYDAAGTATTKVKELAEGQVATNKADIAKLNGDASTTGSVAKVVADAKSELNASIDAAKALTEAEATRAKAAEEANATGVTEAKAAASAAQAAADKAQGEVDLVELDMGDVDTLSTTNKTVVGAINEVLAAVGTGSTAAVVTVSSNVTSDGMLKSYTIKQGDATVGVIDIPKDMVVESGEVVTNPEGQSAGTYIKLVLANVAEPLYINVGTLVDIYKAKANAAQVQVAIDSVTREISATIVAGSIGSTELADGSVVTAKIADANVTKAKLSTAVQASLDKADNAAPQAALDTEVERATAAEAKALSDAKTYTNEEIAKEAARADGVAGQALTDAKAYTDEKNTAMNARMESVEAQLGTGSGSVDEKIATAKSEAIAAAATDATNKANAAQSAANAYTDEEVGKVSATVSTHTTNIADLTERMGVAESDIDSAEGRLSALESKVGDGFVAVTQAEIDSMFTA